MKAVRQLLVAISLGLAATAASAQFVKGNEAVKVMPDGTRKVETPPFPPRLEIHACPAERAGCAGGGWKMVETADGLRECTDIYARPVTCARSTYGVEKKLRLWIVKVHGEWMQCPLPVVGSQCVSIKALPPFGDPH